MSERLRELKPEELRAEIRQINEMFGTDYDEDDPDPGQGFDRMTPDEEAAFMEDQAREFAFEMGKRKGR